MIVALRLPFCLPSACACLCRRSPPASCVSLGWRDGRARRMTRPFQFPCRQAPRQRGRPGSRSWQRRRRPSHTRILILGVLGAGHLGVDGRGFGGKIQQPAKEVAQAAAARGVIGGDNIGKKLLAELHIQMEEAFSTEDSSAVPRGGARR